MTRLAIIGYPIGHSMSPTLYGAAFPVLGVDATYEAWAVDGNRAVAVGTSDYYTDATRSNRERRYHNTYLLEFDDAGRVRSFTENYQLER